MSAVAQARAAAVPTVAPLETAPARRSVPSLTSLSRLGSNRPYPTSSQASGASSDHGVLRSLPLPSTEPEYQDGDIRAVVEQAPCPGQGMLTLLSDSPDTDRPAVMRAAQRVLPESSPGTRTSPDRSLARRKPRMAAASVTTVTSLTTVTRGPILACGAVTPRAAGAPPVPLDEDDPSVATRHTSRADLPDPDAWARRLSQILAEVLTGHRPHTQLVRWTTEQVYRHLRRSIAVPSSSSSRRRTRPVVGTVRVCEPADGIAEVSAVLRTSGRTQALALRLEGMDGRWVITALQTG